MVLGAHWFSNVQIDRDLAFPVLTLVRLEEPLTILSGLEPL